ncbi:MaoC/PaaZ C-terminal domain-containing protein [Amycolatopsis sp. NPDC102389]|uniref:MaoC/PaaZ C-terminal domain-containing protein n=1 Tax=Amycolatopsis sp. NPDC102389 TaxID=3363941 RepID=UPI0037FF6EDB
MNVGDTLPSFTAPTVTRDGLARFASASGDDNPIHLDPAVAVAQGLDDVIAHGMLSMAYLGRLITSWVPQDRIRSLRAKFVGMTPVGAAPVCGGRVRAVEEIDGELRATIALTVKLGDGTTTVRGEAVVAV